MPLGRRAGGRAGRPGGGPGTSRPRTSERRPVIRSARRGAMFRSPASTVRPAARGSGQQSQLATAGQRQERQVRGHDVDRPAGRLHVGSHGDPRLVAYPRHGTAGRSNRNGHRIRAGGSEATCQPEPPGVGSAARCRTPARRRPPRRWPASRSAGSPTSAGTNRWSTAPIARAAMAVRSSRPDRGWRRSTSWRASTSASSEAIAWQKLSSSTSSSARRPPVEDVEGGDPHERGVRGPRCRTSRRAGRRSARSGRRRGR